MEDNLQVARVSSVAFWCSQLCFSRFAHLTSSDAQTIYISPELTSVLTPSCRLRITALLSSGCRATADTESLSSVHSSSTVAELPRWMPIARAVSAKFKAFSFPVIKSYSAIPFSVFRVLQRPQILHYCLPTYPLPRNNATYNFVWMSR